MEFKNLLKGKKKVQLICVKELPKNVIVLLQMIYLPMDFLPLAI
jgi:hypothetical protein